MPLKSSLFKDVSIKCKALCHNNEQQSSKHKRQFGANLAQDAGKHIALLSSPNSTNIFMDA